LHGFAGPFIQVGFSSFACPVLHRIALAVVSGWCQRHPRTHVDQRPLCTLALRPSSQGSQQPQRRAHLSSSPHRPVQLETFVQASGKRSETVPHPTTSMYSDATRIVRSSYMAERRTTDIILLLCSKCLRVLRHEFRVDLRAAGTPREDRGGRLLPAHRSHFRELGLARTCHQGRPRSERRAVRDRPPRIRGWRRSRPPARGSSGASRGESKSLDRLAASVLGYAISWTLAIHAA